MVLNTSLWLFVKHQLMIVCEIIPNNFFPKKLQNIFDKSWHSRHLTKTLSVSLICPQNSTCFGGSWASYISRWWFLWLLGSNYSQQNHELFLLKLNFNSHLTSSSETKILLHRIKLPFKRLFLSMESFWGIVMGIVWSLLMFVTTLNTA